MNMDSTVKLVKIPAGGTMSEMRSEPIRPLFEKISVPGYFSMAMEIPPHLFDMGMPTEDYCLAFSNEKLPRVFMHHGKLRFPSIRQVLWAVGFMNIELGVVIGEKPVRFIHQSFRAHECPWKGHDAWRQILVSRHGIGYSISTVCAASKSQDVLFGYLYLLRS